MLKNRAEATQTKRVQIDEFGHFKKTYVSEYSNLEFAFALVYASDCS